MLPLFLATALAATSAAAPQSPSPTTTVDFSATEHGIAVFPGQVTKGEVVGIIDASVEEVLHAVLDCEGTAEWFPAILSTELVARTDEFNLCAGATAAPWPVSTRTWTLEVTAYVDDSTGEEVYVVPFEYQQGSGNLNEMRGAYHIRRHGDRSVVAYEAHIDLGFWLPDFLVKWGTRTILGNVLGNLENHIRSR